jgi:hypothetical protein
VHLSAAPGGAAAASANTAPLAAVAAGSGGGSVSVSGSAPASQPLQWRAQARLGLMQLARGPGSIEQGAAALRQAAAAAAAGGGGDSQSCEGEVLGLRALAAVGLLLTRKLEAGHASLQQLRSLPPTEGAAAAGGGGGGGFLARLRAEAAAAARAATAGGRAAAAAAALGRALGLCDEVVGEIAALPPLSAEHVSAAQRGAREAALQTLAQEPRLLIALGAERRVPEAVAQVCGAVVVLCAGRGAPGERGVSIVGMVHSG